MKAHPELHCERCGAVLDVEDWFDVTALGDVEPRYIPGRTSCPTEGCGTSCPICKRKPGDVHSGECGPIILGKVVDQVRVTREDCLAVVR